MNNKLSHTAAPRERSMQRRSRYRAIGLALALCAAAASAQADPVPIPNGDFSQTGNFGTVGGGLIGGSGSNVPIGSGPWAGTYFGILGLLAPPSLTISADGASISGIAALNVLGILDNGGYFSQDLALPYASSRRYTLSADVDVGGVLDLAALGQANIGLGFSDGSTTLMSTATAPGQLVNLVAAGGTQYKLSLIYDTPETATGNITVQLLGTPQAVIGLGLLTQVTYSNVRLDSSLIDSVAGAVVAVDGSVQQAVVAQPFAEPLGVRVTNAEGQGVPGVAVTFSAPTSGAGAVLAATSVTTDANGNATTTATANTVAGSYTVAASVAGVDAPATFSFTNLAGAPASLTPVGPATQSAVVSTPFEHPLVVGSADEFGNPTPGIVVRFDAPATGASATLNPVTATTDASGMAQTEGTANAIAGSYDIVARVDGTDVTATFPMTNALPDGTTIDNGGGGAPQAADLQADFLCALVVHVAQPGGAPYAGVQVRFDAPASGASAVLSNGTDSGASVVATTGADGAASVRATANDVAGNYTISATLIGADNVDPLTFAMSNIESLIFRDGFDRPCVVAATP